MVRIFVRAGLVLAAVAAFAPLADFTPSRAAPEAAGRSQTGNHLVAMWARDGKVDTSFPQPSGGNFPNLLAIESDGHGGWFLGGSFDSVGGAACPFLAHISTSGDVDKGWCPRPDRRVTLLARVGGTLYVTGDFSKIGGRPRNGVATLNVRTGDVTTWQPKGLRFAPAGLAATRTKVFVGSWKMAAFDARTGRQLRWSPRFDNRGCSNARGCEVDIGAILVRGNSVYVAGNFGHVQGQKRVGLVALDATSARLLPWKADLNEHAVATVDEVPWQLAAAGQTVYVSHTGFDAFDRIGGVPRDGFAALDARTGAVRGWSPRLPRFEQGIDAFAVSGPVFAVAYEYTKSVYSDVFEGAVRLVDRPSGQKVRWTHVLRGQDFDITFVRIGGGRVLVSYYQF